MQKQSGERVELWRGKWSALQPYSRSELLDKARTPIEFATSVYIELVGCNFYTSSKFSV